MFFGKWHDSRIRYSAQDQLFCSNGAGRRRPRVDRGSPFCAPATSGRKDAFGVGYAELSIVMSLMYATSGLMQTPAGLIVDRLGPARVLISGLGLFSAAVLLYGFASKLWALAALVVVAGLGNCVFHPADYAILSARVAPTRLGRAYGVHNLGSSLGWAAARSPS
jgi:MFS family permease